jgi:hypothetical protein
MSGNKAAKDAVIRMNEVIVATHLAFYCKTHPADTPFDGIQALLLKVSKTSKTSEPAPQSK